MAVALMVGRLWWVHSNISYLGLLLFNLDEVWTIVKPAINYTSIVLKKYCSFNSLSDGRLLEQPDEDGKISELTNAFEPSFSFFFFPDRNLILFQCYLSKA